MNVERAVSIVTGASGGIGSAIALALAERRGRIVVVARRPEPLAEIASAIIDRGGEAVIVAGDVSDPTTSRSAVEMATSRFGGLDLLINAAGFGPPAPLVELTKDDWDAT